MQGDTPNNNELISALAAAGVYDKLFDIVRLVDAQTNKVVKYSGGKTLDTQIDCGDIFGGKSKCLNCQSSKSLFSGENAFSFEYISDKGFIICSVPVVLGGRHLVAELIKDVTEDILADIKESHGVRENDMMTRHSCVDRLTGLMNQNYINVHLPLILGNGKVFDRPVSIAVIAVHNFGGHDKKCGAGCGEYVLSELGKIFGSFIRRDSDFAASLDNGRFLMCFTGADIEKCREICGRIKNKITQTEFSYGKTVFHAEILFGAAETGELGKVSQESLLALAEKRLDEAVRCCE